MERKEASSKEKYIRWFSDLNKGSVEVAGGKAANLGEMYNSKFPIPPGFAVTAQSYKYFLEKTGIQEEIYNLLNNIDVENTSELDEVANKIRKDIHEKEIPEDLQKEILEAYEILGSENTENASETALSILKTSYEPCFVAVRSSATAEDSSEASFAGQQETFLNVKGKENVLEKVKRCFSSLFTSRSIYYRIKKGFKHENVYIAVVVQKMINADKSGVIFSKNPIQDDNNVVIESVFGLGEGIVSGKIEPDKYAVNQDLEIISERIADKKIAITRNSAGENETVRLTEERSKNKVLTNYEIKRLADFALKLEEHYGKPQDIEFAIDSKEIYIVQTRPITTKAKQREHKEISGKEILSGQAASPGIGSGKVKIIENISDLGKIKKGDVLVTEMTNPDMVVAMQKSAAIITNEGGMTSHAAIVSREMGIPAVVGTKKATQELEEGQEVTIDAYSGKIYEGKVEGMESEKAEILPVVDTKIKIKVIVDLPSSAERASKTEIKEIGLTRLEGIIAESGKHPVGFLKNNEIDKYEEIIYSGLSKIGKYFDKMWVRTSDLRSDEYRNLKGSPKEEEDNPMLGNHGIRFSLKHKEILKAELKAIKRVIDEGKKAGILLPQVINVSEVKEVKEILKQINAEDIELGVMIETPASVQIIDKLCEYIKFISFGTNDLTQYTLAIDRNDEQVQEIYDELHPAILSQIEKVISVCKENNVETSICGQAGSKKDMVKFLVSKGIDSISVNADKAKEISEYVHSLESGLDEEKPENIEQEKTIENKEDLKQKPEIEQKTSEIQDKEEKQEFRIDEKGRKLYQINCDNCGKQAEVPFKPDSDRKVFCKECYKLGKNKKQDTGENLESKKEKPENIEQEKPENIEQEENIEQGISQEQAQEVESNIESDIPDLNNQEQESSFKSMSLDDEKDDSEDREDERQEENYEAGTGLDREIPQIQDSENQEDDEERDDESLDIF